MVAFALINVTAVQNFLAHEATYILSSKLKTKVKVEHVSFDLLNHISLKGVYIEDQNKDTLLYAGSLQIRMTDWFLNSGKPILHYIALEKTFVHLYRTPTSDKWNYTFIEDAFASNKKDNSSKPVEFNLEKIALNDVRFYMDDNWVGWNMRYGVGSLELDAKNLDIKKKILDVSEIVISRANVDLRAYHGGRPQSLKIIDTPEVHTCTPFNLDKWVFKVKSLNLKDCIFSLNFNDKIPVADEFDPEHLHITGINMIATDCGIIGDTITGNMKHLEAKERCGVAIKSMKSKISVSPIASICSDLLLETNYSKMKNYYAMHYKHFPDFLNYNDSVTMVGHISDAIVDKRDVAFFAPALRNLPQVVLHVSGDGKGTVANLSGHNLQISDGFSTIKGSATIKGLPDIYKSKINFYNGEIFTTGTGILRYTPMLKDSPDIALDQLSFAYFIGTYEGYIDKFTVKGEIKSNLGNIGADIFMAIPGFVSDSAKYTGNLTVDKFRIGTLLKQSDIGIVSLKENFTGFSFNPSVAQVNLDGIINELSVKNYLYHNISTKGILAKKQFYGNLLIDDPNLALEFDGGLDFSKNEVIVKATAHLLSCNFKALNLTDDSLKASADFDLNCVGSSIDNFSGFALLNNIDMKRNNHKLALDSVSVKTTGDSTNKVINIKSNALTARIKGDYRLSKLPASFQYYLSKYIPNYIKVPSKEAPQQNLEFVLNTSNIDSVLAFFLPTVHGFDTSYISGMFNTTTQNLSVVANIPYGSIGKLHLGNVALTFQGNLNALSVNTTIGNAAIGDSSIQGSLGLTCTLGNDLLLFNIATTTPDTSSTIELNGQIIARKDSLFMTMLPSAFYLNQTKWDIAGDCKVVYSDKYLNVDNLYIKSGDQKITAIYNQKGNDQIILVNTENLDLAQLGSWAGLGYYQPYGKVNGTIKIMNVLKYPYISANMQATNVKMGQDTIGTINLIGDYDQSKKLAIIDPQTGIYLNNSEITASGNISFDSNTNQKLNGVIKFINAPANWSEPFLTGIFSKVKGTVNGVVNIGGKSYDPKIDGTVEVKDLTFHLDYMGCNYAIPYASVYINNDRINLGRIKAKDSYNNTADITGYFSHQLFKDMKMNIKVASNEFEVMKLGKTDNNYFYGNCIAGMDSFTITGPFNNISLNSYNAYPAAKSHIYIPVATTGDAGTYSYVSFKTYGTTEEKIVRKSQYKLNVNLDANLNNLANITILLDPTTGDAIDAVGEGNIQFKMPANNDMRITGNYNIESGTYTFTFKQLEYKKQFKLNSGSKIYFKGPFAETSLDVFATYTAKARLYDLLSATEQAAFTSGPDLTDAKTLQSVNILLHMQDALFSPKLTFDLSVDDKRLESNPAYTKLMLINQDDRQKFDQVASLLLTGSFLSQEGLFNNNSVKTGAINNFSQMLSGTASSTLTNVVNKLLGERKVNINVNYQNYNYTEAGAGINRNQFSATISKNYLDDRLIVEFGGKSDWGRQTAAGGASSYNTTGDFKIQYLISPTGGLRLNAFSTSDYDVTLERPITRSGVGLTWRRSFDNLGDFLKPSNKSKKKEQKQDTTDTVLKSTKANM